MTSSLPLRIRSASRSASKSELRRSVAALSIVVALAAACSGGDDATSSTPGTADGAPVATDFPMATVDSTLTTADTTEPSEPATTRPLPAGVDERSLSGGAGTVFNDSSDAFAQGLPTLTRVERRAFAVGNSFFNENWVTAPASTDGRDGLGPLLNAQSCSTCHFKDGRGEPPVDADDPTRGLLLRISVPGPDGEPIPLENYGNQIQDRSILDVPAEGTIEITTTEIVGSFADGTPYTLSSPAYSIVDLAYGPIPDEVMISPRVAPAVFGSGLLEAVSAETVIAAADPDDADGDGISGRANMLPTADGESVLGRFGWKANAPSVEAQTADAFVGDVGITSSLHPDQNCTEAQADCLAAATGGDPELDDNKLQRVTFYTRTLAVPARRDVDDPATTAGEALFTELGCSSCHTPTGQTGASDIEALANQTIHPYTDLLLHDMGDGLADGRPDFDATGTEWKTPPLWGIGLVETVNGHTRFLHDGRARDLTEAILWHGGEASASQDAFRNLTAGERDALIAFLESL